MSKVSHYEYDEKRKALIKVLVEERPKIIKENDLCWRVLDGNHDSYLRAIYLGQGCWDDLVTVTEEEAQKILKEWGYAPGKRIAESVENRLTRKKSGVIHKDKAKLIYGFLGYLFCFAGVVLISAAVIAGAETAVDLKKLFTAAGVLFAVFTGLATVFFIKYNRSS